MTVFPTGMSRVGISAVIGIFLAVMAVGVAATMLVFAGMPWLADLLLATALSVGALVLVRYRTGTRALVLAMAGVVAVAMLLLAATVALFG